MKTLSQIISRSLTTLAVAGLGLALTPGTASADFLDFNVVESTVPGAAGAPTITVDQATGTYNEVIVLNPDGSFDATLFVTFNNYQSLEGTFNVPDYLGNTFAQQYLLYAVVTATGTFTGTGTIADPIQFEPTDADASLYVDPNSDTTPTFNAPGTAPTLNNTGDPDYLIMTATTIDQAASFGTLVTTGPEEAQGGLYNLVFTDPALTNFGTLFDGESYWLNIPSLNLRAVTDGDFDDADISDGTLTGQTSLAFEAQDVPEPASLALLGLGLFGSAVAARRRRKA